MVPLIASELPCAWEHDEPLHVLDLPQLYSRPSFEVLLAVLDLLKLHPPSWDANGRLEYQPPRVQDDRNAVPAYLSKIVSNGLKWLNSDEEREQVWELASTRLSERSGRTGMPAMTRTWKIPATHASPEFSLEIHEPPLTEDNVGLKTWLSSFLLAKRLGTLGADFLSHLLHGSHETRILELGSGTGLVGLAAAMAWKHQTVLTDLPQIVPNLQRNVDQNLKLIEARGGQVSAHVLDWKNPQSLPEAEHFEIILAADVLYSIEHASLLVPIIKRYMAKDLQSRVVVEIPIRDRATQTMVYEFQGLMQDIDLQLLHEGTESGYDDWGTNEEVKCWWGIWGRSTIPRDSSRYDDLNDRN